MARWQKGSRQSAVFGHTLGDRSPCPHGPGVIRFSFSIWAKKAH
jgi:hypothetical protein